MSVELDGLLTAILESLYIAFKVKVLHSLILTFFAQHIFSHLTGTHTNMDMRTMKVLLYYAF